MPSLTDLTIPEALFALRRGETSSRELTQAYLRRIERLEPHLHTFLALTPELALARADEADQQWAAWRADSSQPHPPLLGIPAVIKDVLCVAGMPCTCGSRILEGFVPPFHAASVERLLAAGVIILGKTNTDEFAMGSSTENSAYGVTHNPWNLSRVPGGSSGGSAAAVAAHLAPFALGTDTGGSVRQPAAYCGVVGFKPSYGRISRYGLVAFGSSLDTVGIFSHTVAEAAAAFSAMAGHDPRDATSMDLPVPEFRLASAPEINGLRIGLPREYFQAGLQADVEVAVRRAVGVLEELGASVQEVSLPHTEYALPVYYLIAPAEASANLARYDGVRYGPRQAADSLEEVFFHTRGERFGPEVKRRIMLGTYALSAGYYDAYYGQAQKVRTLIYRDFETVFKSVDLLAAPVTPTTAFPIGEKSADPLAMYLEDILTIPANLAGIPAVSLPAGFDGRGLPVGMQLMAPSFAEAQLLQAAHAYQLVTDWHTHHPDQFDIPPTPV